MVIRIPKSWNPPHQVVFQKTFRFFGRGAAGKHPLDVTALRDLFTLSADLGERIKHFRIERIARILAGETPVALEEESCVVIHAIPFGAFTAGAKVEFKFPELNGPLMSSSVSTSARIRYNVDGVLSEGLGYKGASSYAQLFHTGIVESVMSLSSYKNGDKVYLRSIMCGEYIIKSVSGIINLFNMVKIPPPIAIGVSIVGVKGWEMGYSGHEIYYHGASKFDRDPIIVPDLIVNAFSDDVDVLVKPIIDRTWQASGWPNCLHYDEKGRWKPRQ